MSSKSAVAAEQPSVRGNGKGYACGIPQTYPSFQPRLWETSSAEYGTSKTRLASLPGVRSLSLALLPLGEEVGLVEFVLRNLRRKSVEVLLARAIINKAEHRCSFLSVVLQQENRTRRQQRNYAQCPKISFHKTPQGLIVSCSELTATAGVIPGGTHDGGALVIWEATAVSSRAQILTDTVFSGVKIRDLAVQ